MGMTIITGCGGAAAPRTSTPIASSDANSRTPTVEQPSYITPAVLHAIMGKAEPTIAVSDSWSIYQNATLGLTLHYPPTWQYHEQEDQSSVAFYPPNVDITAPSALILFTFASMQPYVAQHTFVATDAPSQPITVSTIRGHTYADSSYAIPTQSYYIELPYRSGTFIISATNGPRLNLVPQLQEMLTTMTLRG